MLADPALNQNHILRIHSFVVGLQAEHIYIYKKKIFKCKRKKENKTKRNVSVYVHGYMLVLPGAELNHAQSL